MRRLGRRRVLQSVIPVAGVYTVLGSRVAPAESEAKSSLLEAKKVFRQLVYAENEQPAHWWLRGRKFGVLNGELLPLWDISTGVISQGSLGGEGTFNTTVLEASFQLVLDSQALLEEWTNPYTEVTAAVPVVIGTPADHSYDQLVSTRTAKTPLGKLSSSTNIQNPRISEGTIWLDKTESFELINEDHLGRSNVTRINEFTSYSAAIADLDESYGYRLARCDLDIWSDWMPNMNMSEYPGGMLTRAQGQKLSSYDEFPESFKALFSEYYPHVAGDASQYIGLMRGVTPN